MGSAGEIILFQFLLGLQVFVGFVVLSYGAYVFLSIVQDTAAGNDEVVLAEEPTMERLWKVIFLGWLTICSVVPAMILLSMLHGVLPKEGQAILVTIAAGCSLWLLLPVFLFSSLTSGVWWSIFSPRIVRWLSRRPGSVVRFYFLTAMLGASFIALLGLSAASKSSYVLLVLIAPLLAASFLIYARLIGRLAWVLGSVSVIDQQRPSKRPTSGEIVTVPKENAERISPQHGRAASDKGQDLAGEIRAKMRRGKRALPEESSRRVRFDESEEPSEGTREELLPLPEVTCSAEDDVRPERSVSARPPAYPLISGVWSFPWYPTSLKAWLWLSLGFFVMAAASLYQFRLHQGL